MSASGYSFHWISASRSERVCVSGERDVRVSEGSMDGNHFSSNVSPPPLFTCRSFLLAFQRSRFSDSFCEVRECVVFVSVRREE